MVDSTTQRLFFALWPDDGLRNELAQLSRDIGPRTGKRIRRENLHITLCFLGAVDGRQRDCLEAAADAIRGRSFKLNLDRVAWWSRPRVLFAEPSQIPAELFDLVGQLKSASQSCGFEPERRPFRAHLTLARKATRGPVSTPIETQAWSVRDFCLVESRTLPSGAEYTVLRSWPLG